VADKSVIFTLIAKDSASAALKSVESSMHGLHGASGRLTGAIGGLGGALTSLPALIGGAGVVAAIVGMTKAAADDEAAQKRLGAAAKANIPGFDGNTAALEKTVTATQNMAFTDDAARDSLTRLLTSTKDVGEATRLNGLAMDFARLKGIPLADAANIIGKVHDGNVGILSRYGIVLEKGTTATEALAAMQTVSAGQAQTYADTTAGGMDRMGIGIGELGESVGTLFLPIMQGLVTLLNTSVIPAMEGVVTMIKGWFAENSTLVTGIGTTLSTTLGNLWTLISTQIIPVVVDIGGKFGAFVNVIATKVVPVLLDFAKRVWEGGLGKAIGVVAAVLGDVLKFLGDLYTTIYTNADIMAGLATVGDLIGVAFGLVADAISAAWGFIKNLFSAIASNTAVMDGLKTIVGLIGTAFGIFRDAAKTAWEVVQGFFDWIQNNPVAQVIGGLGDAISNTQGAQKPAFTLGGPQAEGGPVRGGVGYLVGERGPELFVPGSSGGIIPNGALGAGGPVSLNVTVSGAAIFDPYGAAAQQIADALLPGVRRALTRNGMSLA
jgi:hypothetical protein